jgi:MoaA/NifB/PqqE/SkfB family radical SAM enzyme
VYNLPELTRDAAYLDALADSLEHGSPPPLLRCAKIKITSRCNLRCVMCKYWQTESEQVLPSARWREVFAELAGLGCRKLHFSGGEVFLRPDFLDLVESATARGLKVNMTTNGTLVSREAVRRIADLGVNGVSISFDGPSARSHNAIRGRDYAFKRSLRTARWLRRAAPRTKLRLNFVVMRHNYDRLPEMVRLAGELGARELIPMPVDEKGPRRNRLSKAQIRHYNREIAPGVLEQRRRCGFSVAPGLVYPFGVTEEEVRFSAKGLYARGFFERRACLVPWLHAFFAWNGDTFLCCMTNGRMEPLGNVGVSSVGDVFRGEGYRRVREAFLAGRHLPSCHRCDLFLPENALLHAALDETGRAPRAFAEGAPRAALAPELGVDGPFEGHRVEGHDLG